MEHLDWDDETVEETLAAYPDQVFYDNWEAPRHPVDLEDYPVLTTSDPPVENVVYLEDGTRVRRHRLRGEETNETCGMMINLATIAEFFDNAIHTIDDLDDDELNAPAENCPSGDLHLYPQAFLGNKGHYQAGRLPTCFRRVIRRINTVVVAQDEEEGQPANYPITGGTCQAYNTVMHRLRTRTSLHDVQLAEQTAFAACALAGPSEKQKYEALRVKLSEKGLAFTRLEDRLESDGVSKALRMENNYDIDLKLLRNESCNAS